MLRTRSAAALEWLELRAPERACCVDRPSNVQRNRRSNDAPLQLSPPPRLAIRTAGGALELAQWAATELRLCNKAVPKRGHDRHSTAGFCTHCRELLAIVEHFA
jgi:hypothetical protein